MNAAWSAEVDALARATRPAATLQVLDAIADARRRLPANVPPLLALEAMLVTARAREGGVRRLAALAAAVALLCALLLAGCGLLPAPDTTSTPDTTGVDADAACRTTGRRSCGRTAATGSAARPSGAAGLGRPRRDARSASR